MALLQVNERSDENCSDLLNCFHLAKDMLVYLYLDIEYSSVKDHSSLELHPLKTFCFFELVTSFSSLFCKVLHDRGNTIIRKRKLTKEASIGRKMVAVATLEVNSVNVVIMIQTHITIA